MSESLRFTVVGIPDSDSIVFQPEAEAAVRRGSVFSGGKRHHALMSRFLPAGAEWIDVTVPLADVFDAYRRHSGEIVVFASGDPLFYGYAATLQREFPDADINVIPWFSSLQTLAHRLVVPYQDMRCVSLTGRPWHEFYAALISGAGLVGVLTDRNNTPAEIARRMLDFGYDNYSISVGENLGNKDSEAVTVMSLQDAVARVFSPLNCVILRRLAPRPRPFGIPDKDFVHLPGRERMITKMPVRLLSLSMLDIHDRSVMWDIGFCTGSVSIEAKLQAPHLRICSFEVRPESEELMAVNMRRFGTPGIDFFIGDFLEADVAGLPRPDAVFIGGHGGKLREIIAKVRKYMLPGGTVVFNSVSESSLKLFEEATAACGMAVVERHTVHLDDFNPITILKAQ